MSSEQLIYLEGISDDEKNVEDVKQSFLLERRNAVMQTCVEIETLSQYCPKENVGFGQSTVNNINGILYIFGGCNRKVEKLSNEMKCFNVEKRTWNLLDNVSGSPPSPRFGHTAVNYGNKIIFFGGQAPSNSDVNHRLESFNDVAVFDVMSKSWEPFDINDSNDSKPVPRSSHTSIVFESNMLIFGGASDVGLLNDIWILNLSTGVWNKQYNNSTYVPEAREMHSACLYRSDMFIIGGRNQLGLCNDLWTFDLNGYKWTKISELLPLGRCCHSSVTLESGMIIIFGGYMEGANEQDIITLDAVTHQFDHNVAVTRNYPLRFGHGACSDSGLTDDSIIIFGGVTSNIDLCDVVRLKIR